MLAEANCANDSSAGGRNVKPAGMRQLLLPKLMGQLAGLFSPAAVATGALTGAAVAHAGPYQGSGGAPMMMGRPPMGAPMGPPPMRGRGEGGRMRYDDRGRGRGPRPPTMPVV